MISFNASRIAFDDTDDVGDGIAGVDGDHSPAPRLRLVGPLVAQAQLLGEESNPRRAPCRLRLEGRAATSRRWQLMNAIIPVHPHSYDSWERMGAGQ